MAEIDGVRKAMTQSPTAAELQFAMDKAVREVVLISGHLCTGKSGLARAVSKEFG